MFLFTTFCNDTLKFITNSRNMKENFNIKIFRSWNLCPKPNLVISFKAILLMIVFEHLILKFHIWTPNTTTLGTMDKVQVKQHFLLIFRHLIKKYPLSTFLVYLTVLAPSLGNHNIHIENVKKNSLLNAWASFKFEYHWPRHDYICSKLKKHPELQLFSS